MKQFVLNGAVVDFDDLEGRKELGWRKSTKSTGNGGSCVEVLDGDNGSWAVRDSKDPHGPVLVFTADERRAFIDGVKDGEFDL